MFLKNGLFKDIVLKFFGVVFVCIKFLDLMIVIF